MSTRGLQGKIIAKKGKMAEIEIEDPEGGKQKILVQDDLLGTSFAVGEQVNLYFTSAGDGVLQEKKLAKVILEEILNGK